MKAALLLSFAISQRVILYEVIDIVYQYSLLIK